MSGVDRPTSFTLGDLELTEALHEGHITARRRAVMAEFAYMEDHYWHNGRSPLRPGAPNKVSVTNPQRRVLTWGATSSGGYGNDRGPAWVSAYQHTWRWQDRYPSSRLHRPLNIAWSHPGLTDLAAIGLLDWQYEDDVETLWLTRVIAANTSPTLTAEFRTFLHLAGM